MKSWPHCVMTLAAVAGMLRASPPSTTSNFGDLPDATFFDMVNPSSNAPLGPFFVDVGGTLVTVTSTSSLGGPDVYRMGFFDWSAVGQRILNDPAIDPGEWDGFYSVYTAAVTGHPVLDFDVPLAAFGITTMQEWRSSSVPSQPDTLFAYDGPGGTGNLIGSITTKPAPGIRFASELDFVAVLAGDGPPIRSVVIAGSAEPTAQLFLDGMALLIAADSGCEADLSGSSDPNDPAYGEPDGNADASDFFYFLDQFAADNLSVADLTGSADPNDPSYGTPDGVIDAADFFYFLDVFVAGCP